MHNKYLYILFLLAGIFTSCAEDVDTNGLDTSNLGITASVREKIAEDIMPESRSSLTYQYDTKPLMKFGWEDGDWITVIPETTDNTIVQYQFDSFYASKATANFKAEKFELKKDERYFSFSMKEDNERGILIPSKGNITVNYAGQVQIGNASTEPNATEPVAAGKDVAEVCEHLGDYDFMAACGVCEQANQATFEYNHLGSTYRIRIKGLPTNVKFKAMEVFDSQNTMRQPKRTFNLMNGFDPATGSYSPALNEPDQTTKEYIAAERFTLSFKTKESNGTLSDGIYAAEGSTDEGGVITGYIELPPLDFTARSMIVRLIPVDNSKPDYYAKSGLINRKYGSGYIYRLNAKSQPADIFPVTIKVNHAWQHGQAVTRATTGDPGVEEKFPKPSYLYCILCVNGKVVESDLGLNGRTAAAVNKITTAETDWTRSEDIDTYKNMLTFSAGTVTNPTMRAYIVASCTDLMSAGTNIFSGISKDASEETVKALLYSIPSTSTTTKLTDGNLSTPQAFMRDLYSTPWGGETSSTIFAGDIKNPYQDIILYHVAAKVDLKWNSPSKLSGNVSVNNVNSTNLSLFIPTNNTGATGSYTVTSPIDPGTMYNGREYFYLPQFNTYNVTIGDKAAEDATFTPYIKDGFTSWLRWLGQY